MVKYVCNQEREVNTMEHIKDYATYNNAMAKSLFDKIWWIDKLPTNIDTIIDFGCADGALFAFVHKLFPNRFRFIGIDNNAEMVAQAKSKARKEGYRVEIYSHIPRVKNAVLVMNSVMHEVLSYSTYWDTVSLFEEIDNSGVEFIAIRDMYEHNNDFECIIPENERSAYLESAMKVRHNSTALNLLEYLLKADYKTNWSREVEERYLWNWANWFWNLRNYEVILENDFSLVHHRREWRTRYSIPLEDLRNLKTHKKMLLEIKKSA